MLAALRLSFGMALAARRSTRVFGFIIAWVLVRYRFPGKRLLDALIDLPFALPTAVAGIALSTLYAPNGWIGSLLAGYGIRIAYTPWGVLVAMVFIGLPFTVRTLQPVLQRTGPRGRGSRRDLGRDAAADDRAGGAAHAVAGAADRRGHGLRPRRRRIWLRSSSSPAICRWVSEIAPLLIVIKLEQYDYAGAAAIGVVMLAASFVMLLALNGLQVWAAKQR